ncbi:glycosyltransferase family 1 protein [Streptomyces sp. A7024]|uniref:Glycosyltransferase family 1 protein n=1 Tax=Streptomyces coryli TaxID=1128680 RepID=A0A6G4UC31_9ACTN|nr:glycosyltransferase [Streptomyces coryli]NGN69734.1 glycosyltransferase family 1 protein [Streptomyces coryli]
MSRFLFVVPPLAGHIHPAAAVAAELAERGHEISWAGQPAVIERLIRTKARIYPTAGPTSIDDRPRELRGVAALKFLWEDFFGPLAQAMAPGVTTAALEAGPDVMVVDQQTVAGALVAERLGVPYVTSSTTSAELSGSLVGMPKVDEWITGLLDGLRQRLGDPSARYDPRFSPRLSLVFSTEELTGAQPLAQGPVAYVGPALGPRPDVPDFPWHWIDADDSRDLALISLGTANTAVGARFLESCVQAVRARSDRLRAVVVDPGGVLGEPAADDDVLIHPAVPQLSLLEQADAVVCHAGHNTVTEALWHGVPLVVAPIRDDQPVVASQVTGAGAGVRVRFGRADAVRIGGALDAVLREPDYRATARRIRDSFRAAGGAGAAAVRLEQLAAEEEEEEEEPWWTELSL